MSEHKRQAVTLARFITELIAKHIEDCDYNMVAQIDDEADQETRNLFPPTLISGNQIDLQVVGGGRFTLIVAPRYGEQP